MTNRENLKNGITGLYLTGNNKWVYKIKSPNGRHHVLVNRTAFAKLLNRNNHTELHRLISNKNHSHVARQKSNMRNVTYPVIKYLATHYPNQWNNLVPARNYVFRKWNNNKGMVKPRGPFGAPVKLTNVNFHQLTNKNLRNLRALRRQNTKNNANFARQQAAKNAERRKYVYRIYYRINNHHGSIAVVNANLGYLGGNVPRNATYVPNHNTSNIRAKFRRWITSGTPAYSMMNSVNIRAYKLKN
jgi:hypothetical protein